MCRASFNCTRITPIYMGSTKSLANAISASEDHPHIHGEHVVEDGEIAAVLGSPPYTWGAQAKPTDDAQAERITPIYMGSTDIAVLQSRADGDHPHIHGEHLSQTLRQLPLSGSPPYTWGARQVYDGLHTGIRITPIYMGSTSRPLITSRSSKDHPHIHGEHGMGRFQEQRARGSPPYTWGAH